jgi:hypothetical protein
VGRLGFSGRKGGLGVFVAGGLSRRDWRAGGGLLGLGRRLLLWLDNRFRFRRYRRLGKQAGRGFGLGFGLRFRFRLVRCRLICFGFVGL